MNLFKKKPDAYTKVFREMIESRNENMLRFDFPGWIIQREDNGDTWANYDKTYKDKIVTTKVYMNEEDANFDLAHMQDSDGWYIIPVFLYTTNKEFTYEKFKRE